MKDDMNHKLRILKSACTEELHLSLFGIIALLVSLMVFWAALEEGGGLWLGIACLAGAYIGDRFAMRGPWNPLKFMLWGYYPFERFLRDETFSKKAEKYVKKILSETNLLPLRILFFIIPITMVLLSLHSTAVDLKYIIAAVVSAGIYFAGVIGTVPIPVWYKARDSSRISQFFGVPEARWEKIEPRPKVHRPTLVTYISIPFIAVGAFGIVASLLVIFRIPPFLTPYNPFGMGLLVIFISLIPLWIGRGLLRMSKIEALAAMIGTVFFSFISLLLLVGSLLRSILSPSSPPLLTPLSTILLFLGICISIPILWVLKKQWKKFR